ncbi:putative signal transducing protein [Pedobacter terrae]|uniref:putative signal transducing protein n=1 Tax=Pedobacter terrae TaxID=405671 RepID=UPI002FF72519
MNDTTVVYSTFYNPMEANIIKAKLEDSGFACFLADENVSTIQPLYNQAIGGVKLIVFERDVEAINALLAEDNSLDFESSHEIVDEEESVESKTVCEKCGSTNVGYGMATDKKYSLWATILAFLTFTTPIKANKCHHCYDCGHEFE